MKQRLAICDLDGTLLDSDGALVAAFVALGIDPSAVSFGHVIGDECTRLGISVDDYVSAYDDEIVQPFAGVGEMISQLGRWAVCSNKHPVSGHAELSRLDWKPEAIFFTDSFAGPKAVEPVMEAMGIDASDVVFLGDTAHDRACARRAGVTFALAGWNPRARAESTDVVLSEPGDLLGLLGL
jgi:HAD superfamily hydrolase (TIGR01549 family)